MLSMPAVVNATEAVAARRSLTEALARETGSSVVVDASNLRQFDSSALAVLLACRRLAAAANKPFSVRGLPPKLASLATLYGVDKLLLALPTEPGSQ